MTRLIFPVLFLVMPLAEIAMFILVGREIGIGTTLLLVLASTIAGAVLLRIQGLDAIRRIQEALRAGGNPGRPLVHGVMIVLAAILLILPGFLSDIVGILLFIPAVRDRVWSLIKNRVTVVTRRRTGRNEKSQRPAEPRVIDLEENQFSRGQKRPGGGDGAGAE